MSIEQTHRQEVSDRARLLWERAGKPEGRDQEFWLHAEGEVLGAERKKLEPPIRVEVTSSLDAGAQANQPLRRAPRPKEGPARQNRGTPRAGRGTGHP